MANHKKDDRRIRTAERHLEKMKNLNLHIKDMLDKYPTFHQAWSGNGGYVAGDLKSEFKLFCDYQVSRMDTKRDILAAVKNITDPSVYLRNLREYEIDTWGIEGFSTNMALMSTSVKRYTATVEENAIRDVGNGRSYTPGSVGY